MRTLPALPLLLVVLGFACSCAVGPNYKRPAVNVPPDYRGLAPLMRKPSATVMMTFSSDPQLGMTTRKFTGTAVVFVSTVTFGTRTASLR